MCLITAEYNEPIIERKQRSTSHLRETIFSAGDCVIREERNRPCKQFKTVIDRLYKLKGIQRSLLKQETCSKLILYNSGEEAAQSKSQDQQSYARSLPILYTQVK